MTEKHQALPPLDPLQRYSITEAKSYLRCSHGHLFEKIKKGELRVLKDGRRTYFPGTELIKASTLGALRS